MARPKKCPICELKILSTDETISMKEFPNRTIHKKCGLAYVKSCVKQKKEKIEKLKANNTTQNKTNKQVKRKEELKEGLDEKTYKERQKLYEYIKELQNTPILTGKTYKTIDTLYKKNYSYVEIYNALWWVYGIQGYMKGMKTSEQVPNDDITGFIIYWIDEALKNYNAYKENLETNKNILLKEKENSVSIKNPIHKPRNIIDISLIGSKNKNDKIK